MDCILRLIFIKCQYVPKIKTTTSATTEIARDPDVKAHSLSL